MTPPAVAQYAYNLFNRSIELEISEALSGLNIGVLSYYPLAQGILTGKYNNEIPKESRASSETLKTNMWDFTPEKIELAKKLSELALSLNTTSTILSINWCLMNSNVKSVITSVSSTNQLEQLLQYDSFQLTEDIKKEIELIFDNHPKNQYTGINF
jgi:aryl-alcohol dehydrogenase-like predicted oxidoreductase